jgi:4-hydroxy-4-methyl-2-oxoglutarate aldolase
LSIKVNTNVKPLPAELLAGLAKVSPATIGHLLESGFVGPEIRALVPPPARLVGRALTVRIVSPDSAPVHMATELVLSGDVLVVDTGGDFRHAPVGEMVALAVKVRGGIGIIVDGVITDIVEIRRLGTPVFARGTSQLTTKVLGLSGGFVNGTVNCGRAIVHPGDIVLADENGVLILEPAVAAEVVLEALRREAREVKLREHLRHGGSLAEWSGASRFCEPRDDSESESQPPTV